MPLSFASGGFSGDIGVATGTRLALSGNGAASTPILSGTGTWFTGGSATTTKPYFLIEPNGTTSTAWSTSGTGLGLNAATGFAGNLLDAQVAGTSKAKIDSSGNIVTALGNIGLVTGGIALGFAGVSVSNMAGGQFQLFEAGTLRFAITDVEINCYNSGTIGWSSTSSANGSKDVKLQRDAANILALRNSTSAQGLRVYNTYTDASIYERGIFDWNVTANTLTIGTQAAGTGTSRNLQFIVGGTALLEYGISVGNAWTSAATGGIRAQSFTALSTSGIASNTYLYFSSSTTFHNRSDGVLTLSNFAENDFGRLQFGGTTSSFPSLKRSSTAIHVRLADDSADADFKSGNLAATGSQIDFTALPTSDPGVPGRLYRTAGAVMVSI